MEEQIGNLLELSKQYVGYAISDGHVEGWQEYGNADVYVSGTVKSVCFDRDNIEVMIYNNSIKIPITANSEYLQAIYEDAKNYLEKLKK